MRDFPFQASCGQRHFKLARNLPTSNPAAACFGCHIDRFRVEEIYSKALAKKAKKNSTWSTKGGSIEPSNLCGVRACLYMLLFGSGPTCGSVLNE